MEHYVGRRNKNMPEEIVMTVKSNPSLSSLEVAEKHFGPQRHGHVYCFGGGVKKKQFRDSKEVYIRDLEEKLSKKDEENHDLKRRMDRFESRLNTMEIGKPFSRDQPCTPNNDHPFDEGLKYAAMSSIQPPRQQNLSLNRDGLATGPLEISKSQRLAAIPYFIRCRSCHGKVNFIEGINFHCMHCSYKHEVTARSDQVMLLRLAPALGC